MVRLQVGVGNEFDDLRLFASTEIKVFAKILKRQSIPPKIMKSDKESIHQMLIMKDENVELPNLFRVKNVRCKLNFLEVIEKAELKIEQLKDHIIKTNLSSIDSIDEEIPINQPKETTKTKRLATIKEESEDLSPREPFPEKSLLTVKWTKRNVLDLGLNLRENANMYTYAQIPSDVTAYFENRSQISRLQDVPQPNHVVAVCKCTDCNFQEYRF